MRARGVTQEQINSAMGDATTKLPPGIAMPESWKKNWKPRIGAAKTVRRYGPQAPAATE